MYIQWTLPLKLLPPSAENFHPIMVTAGGGEAGGAGLGSEEILMHILSVWLHTVNSNRTGRVLQFWQKCTDDIYNIWKDATLSRLYHILFVESVYLHLNTFKSLWHHDKQLFQVSAKIFIDGQSFKDHCANQTAWIFWISILSTYKLRTSKSNWSQVSAENNELWRPRTMQQWGHTGAWSHPPQGTGR